MGEIRQKYPAQCSVFTVETCEGRDSTGLDFTHRDTSHHSLHYRPVDHHQLDCPHYEHYRIARYVTALEHEVCRYTSVIWTWETGPKLSEEVVKMIQYFTGKLLAGHSVRQYFTCLILTAHLGVPS